MIKSLYPCAAPKDDLIVGWFWAEQSMRFLIVGAGYHLWEPSLNCGRSDGKAVQRKIHDHTIDAW